MGMLEDLTAQLDALDGRTITVTQVTPTARPLTEEEIDRIHDGLLRKRRANGTLGLSDD